MTTTLLFVIVILLLLLLVDTKKQRKKLERYFAILSTPGIVRGRRTRRGWNWLFLRGLKNVMGEAASSLDREMITLVIPTHNRHRYLQRSLDYYGSWSIRILVIDSSETRFDQAVPASVEYMHLPGLAFGEKIGLAMEKVVTPYVLLSADDDLISAVSVKAMLSHLEEHPSHACAQGWHAGFSPQKKKKLKWRGMHLFAKELQIDGSDPGERILKQCASYMNCFYALHRTPVLKHFFCQVCPSLPKETILKRPELLEIGQAVNTVAHGGHATLPMLWIAREMIVDSAGASAQASNAQADPSVAAKQEEEVFQALATALAGVIDAGDANVLFQHALRSYKNFKGKWARKMFAHFGPVENVVYSPEDAALVHQVEKLVRRHPLTQG